MSFEAARHTGWCLGGIALSVGTVTGCGPAVESPAVTRADSAGVQITYAQRPSWGSGEGWTVESLPAVDIGRDQEDTTQLLSIVGAVQPLGDGRIVVQDNGTFRLVIFDSTGRRLGTIGRQGRGPGEFEGMWGTYRCRGDTLIVDQGRAIGVFAFDGAFVGRYPLTGPAGSTARGIEGVSHDCASVLLEDREASEPQAGVFAESAVLWWWKRHEARWDTVHRFPGPELSRITVLGRAVGAGLPFGRRPVWTAFDDRVYFGAGDRPEVQVFGPTGRLERVIRWHAELALVTGDDRSAYEDRRRRYLERHPEEAIVYRPLADYPVPRHKPLFVRALVDELGRLWVLQYPFAAGGLPHVALDEPTSESERWWLFGHDDTWYGTVTMPPGFTLQRAQRDRLYGVYVDTSAAEHVRVHRLIRPD